MKNISQPVTVFIADNSNKSKYVVKTQDVKIIDNTDKNYTGSSGHCKSIESSFNVIDEDYVILIDNDVLFLKPIDELVNVVVTGEYDICGEIGHDVFPQDRLFPYFCIINLKKIKDCGIHYYRENSIIKGVADTGASFLIDCKEKNLKIKEIKLKDYIVHLKNGSFGKKDYKEWLKRYEKLWNDKADVLTNGTSFFAKLNKKQTKSKQIQLKHDTFPFKKPQRGKKKK